ncbi:hypothetical protein JB92DRAFT_3099521 [Gautieria morchelliformis]|nr:hypothetical protein JB92DRAFT_3099521 [Gautieria morchelliformis]
MNHLQLPGLSDLHLTYDGNAALAAADRGRLTLPPLRPPRPATPPLPIPAPLPRLQPRPRTGTVNPPHPIPATVPARRDHRRAAPKAKARVKGKSGKAQGQTARGGSSPRKTIQHFTSMDSELDLSSEPWRISMPLVNTRDHGEQRRGRGGAAGRRVRRGKLVVHQYEFVRQPDGSVVRSEWVS